MCKGQSKGFLDFTLSCKLVVNTHFSRQEKHAALCTRSVNEHQRKLSTARSLTSSEQVSLENNSTGLTPKGGVVTALRTWGAIQVITQGAMEQLA